MPTLKYKDAVDRRPPAKRRHQKVSLYIPHEIQGQLEELLDVGYLGAVNRSNLINTMIVKAHKRKFGG